MASILHWLDDRLERDLFVTAVTQAEVLAGETIPPRVSAETSHPVMDLSYSPFHRLHPLRSTAISATTGE